VKLGNGYTIGIQRHFSFGWKRYTSVVRHEIEAVGAGAHLVLTFADGTVQTVPNIGKRAMRVYPDYQQEKARLEAYQRDVNEHSEKIAEQKVSDFMNRQQQALAARQNMAVANGMPQVPIQR